MLLKCGPCLAFGCDLLLNDRDYLTIELGFVKPTQYHRTRRGEHNGNPDYRASQGPKRGYRTFLDEMVKNHNTRPDSSAERSDGPPHSSPSEA